VAEPFATGDNFRKNVKKLLAIGVVEKYFLPGVTARGEMINGSRVLKPERTRHGLQLSRLMYDCKT
jgi:hypothetical protein